MFQAMRDIYDIVHRAHKKGSDPLRAIGKYQRAQVMKKSFRKMKQATGDIASVSGKMIIDLLIEELKRRFH
ncbi:hypothetical protein D6779_09785 [Candidatus Parcubacteria bacterium]|nr:MAG: hypothetical protein D6779_09785 [Candidatus Parcubacteria bacterium]